MQMRWMMAGIALLAACTGAAAQGVKIGFVDSRRIELESAPFVRANEALKREFGPREQELLAFQKQINADRARFDKEASKLTPDERNRRGNALANAMKKSDQLAVALAEDVERRKREVRGSLLDEANAAVKTVAEAGNYDLILPTRQTTFASPKHDITELVLKEMARRAASKP